ncbi:LuxR C-terminal-related transcriptional regulator [Variovorax sp. J22P168]|uniref:helix-turn-helix transcriptional regulator n=1 Tax=Variovorax jilinensis TaxID=3053513 RepID=UPI0025751F7C|nr:LuxR C-terminal-related transcriptional regulator [Variovorax sp. J22P168]MDM0015273.1 LuxR C-terminal-related transcriptional regulator [Variovorax sp. J22P168]
MSASPNRIESSPQGSPVVPSLPTGRVPPRLVARERLLARLVDERRRRCLVVTGPAGSGKTTLLAAWRQALVPLGFEVAWVALTPEDNEPSRFFESLIAALAAVSPALVSEALILEDAGIVHPDGMERMAITLVGAIESQGREMVLVLDDLQHLKHPAVLETLQWLLDYAPPRLHIALSSRGSIPLSQERLRVQGQVLALDQGDLRFTPAETEQFLKLHVGELDSRTVRLLHELTDGWVAGLQLFAVDWRKRRQGTQAPKAESFTQVPLRDARAFTHYFEQEVLARLPTETLDVLVSLAPCSRVCPSLCAALSGRPETVGEASVLLARLESDNVFLVPVQGPPPHAWYRLHPLLRETLIDRFARWDEGLRRSVHARAFEWFRAHGDLAEAVRHGIEAGQDRQAAELVEQCAEAMFVRSERRDLISLLRMLPTAEVQRSFRLRLWSARAQLYQRELRACDEALDSLEHDLPAGDPRLYQVALLRAAVAVQRDDTEGALKLLPRLLDMPAETDSLTIGGRNNILSWLYMHQGEYEKARRIQQDSPPLLVQGAPLLSTPSGLLQGRCLVGLSWAMEGQMTQAERTYRAVVADAERCGRACADTYYLATALLADVLYELDDTKQARELLSGKADVLERISIPDAVLRAFRVLAAAQLQEGHRMEAFACLERLEDYAIRHGLDRLLAHSLADQIHLHQLQGEMTAAVDVLTRLDALGAAHAHAQASALADIPELVERAHVRLDLMHGDLEGASQRVASLLARCEARGHGRTAAQLMMQDAVIEARRGRPETARRKLVDALGRGHRLGLQRSLLDADPSARRLVRELAATEKLDPVLAFYVGRLQTTSAAPAHAARASGVAMPVEDFSAREIEVLRLLAQAMSNKKIARALGLSPETVKWYLSRIYGKLRVTGRDEAVARVRDLGWDRAGAAPGELPR